MSRDARFWAAGGLLTAAALAASAVLYPRLPATIPTHWDLHGRVDGTGAKTWAAFLVPGGMAGLMALFAVLPWLSPRRFEVDRSRPAYLYLMLVLLGLLAYLHGLTLLAALGHREVGRALVGGVFVVLALIGPALRRVRRNFYIGVRTPWTLASEPVWEQTHRLAAWMFVLAGAGGLVLVVIGVPLIVPLVGLIVVMTAVVLYSLVLYKRLERRGEA